MMTLSSILRRGAPIKGCLQQLSNPASFQHMQTNCQQVLSQPFFSRNISQKPVSMPKELKNPETARVEQVRLLHRSSTLQDEDPKNPLETTKRVVQEGASKAYLGLGNLVQLPRLKRAFSFFSVRSLFSTPSPYLIYGIGGIIPFAAAPAYMLHSGIYCPQIAHAQIVYGATILSFLGGVSWGDKLDSAREETLKSLFYSISLPLLGWVGVLAHPNPVSFLLLLSGVAVAGVKDVQNPSYPDWFKNLRFLLSSVVFFCLFSTALFSLTMRNSSSSKEHK